MLRNLLALAVVMTVATTAFGQAISFTGDAPTDFAGTTFFNDPQGDVGIPSNFPVGTISGWDLDGVWVSYDSASDTLFVGFDSLGIFGDADGDGDPSGSSAALSANGGIDRPDLGGSESFTFSMDLNNDGSADVIAGVGLNEDITAFRVAMFQGSLFAPYAAFGPALPANTGSIFMSPSAGAPDLEFTIVNFAQLVGMFSQPGQTNIGFHAFAGSLDDDGVGEDFLPGAGQLLSFPNPVSAKLGDCLFVDANCDGIKQSTETGVPSVTVSLYDPSDLTTAVATTMTDANGNYQFCVDPGSYVVGFPVVAGHYYTNKQVGMDPTVDSDAGIDGFSDVVTLGATDINLTLDAGYCVCTGVLASVMNLGGACNDPMDPILTVNHAPWLGTSVTATLTSAFPNAAVFPYFSFAPVTPTPVPGTACQLYLDVLNPANLFLLPLDVTDAMGTWTFNWIIPNDPSLIGTQIIAQIRICTPGGPAGPFAPSPDRATNGLLLTIGCP